MPLAAFPDEAEVVRCMKAAVPGRTKLDWEPVLLVAQRSSAGAEAHLSSKRQRRQLTHE